MKAMSEIEKAEAAVKLEFACYLFNLAIGHFEDIPGQHPQLRYFISELFESISNGEIQIDLGSVVEFLRDQFNDEDGYIQNRCLGWNSNSEEEDGEKS